MSDDDLHKPLGLDRASRDSTGTRASRRARTWLLAAIVAGAAVTAFVALHGFAAAPQAPPQATATIQREAPAPRPPAAAPAKAAAGLDQIRSAARVEMESGVKVVRAGGGGAPDSMIIDVPPPHAGLTPAPDPRLVEMCPYGPLPRIGADGARPADVYARPAEVNTALKAGAPRIAIVIGGLGLDRALTAQAIASLPGAVTFAFAPYGHALRATVAEARAKGHEVILQVPMEPIDYPQTNPGPHLLLTSLSPAQNADNLHWLMSRFSGYVGIANFLGAKFTANVASFAPVLQEIGERGLFYLDDGTSPQSLAMTLAAQDNVPAVKADVVLDAAADGIDAALVKLEAIARAKGLAIGVASALPESLEKIGRFARAAQSRGLALIPLSAAVGKTTSDIVDRGP